MCDKYWWIIIDDKLSEKGHGEAGISGPRRMKTNPVILSNPTEFKMYDDDGEHYYTGILFGDFQGLEPLDDFGMPNAGCTEIRIDGKTI